MVMIFGSPSVTATSTATRSAVVAFSEPVSLVFRGAPATSMVRFLCRRDSCLAVSIDTAGVGKAIPVGSIGGAAVIGAVIAVGMAGAVVAGQRRRARQQRHTVDPWRVGHHAHRREQHVRILFLDDDQLPTPPHVDGRRGGGNRGPVIVVGAGQARRQFGGGANRGALGRRGAILDGVRAIGGGGSDRENCDQQ